MRHTLFLIGSVLALASCASISEEACRAGDWQGIGRTDGAAGRSPDYINRHADACAKIGIAPDLAAWRTGREEGLRQYCTPQNAYRVGRNGTKLAPYCPAADRAYLNQANLTGLQYHDLSRQISELNTQSNDLDNQIRRISDNASDEDLRERRALRRERARVNERIRDLEFQRIRYSEFPA